MAEHMFAKCKQFTDVLTASSAETLADLLYEIGKDSMTKRNFETATRWLERAYDMLGEQDMEFLSPEASELRLSTMHSIGTHLLDQMSGKPDMVDSPSTHEAEHI
jgi:hypothetical protein